MPEGDTIHTIAAVLRPDLEGAELYRLALPTGEVPLISPTRVTAVRAVGKHLLIALADASRKQPRVLRVHLGMKGSWHRYRPSEDWGRSASQRHVRLDTAAWSFVCFRPPQAVVYSDPRAVAAGVVGQLGPDVLADELAIDEILRRTRLATNAAVPIASLLLDQQVACGIGNVYKSESLFSVGVRHDRLVSDIDDATVVALYQTARAWMQDSVAHPRWRVTTGDTRPSTATQHRHWVYRRANRPCRRCATIVQSVRTGVEARMTYFCPTCQR